MQGVQGNRGDDQPGLLDLPGLIPGSVCNGLDLAVPPQPQLVNPRDEADLAAVAEEALLEGAGELSDAPRGVEIRRPRPPDHLPQAPEERGEGELAHAADRGILGDLAGRHAVEL